METNYPWLEIAQELQSISQEGLTYTQGPFDKIRYERLREIASQILADYSNMPLEQVLDMWASYSRYPTPKVDVRAVVMQDDKILLVKEADNQLWSMPGGWAEIGCTPSENAIKEVREETGLIVSAKRLLAVWDKKCHPHAPPEPDYVYKMAIHCEVQGGELRESIETTELRWFGPAELPPLSVNRNTESQILWAMRAVQEDLAVVVD
ncbi:MAG: NUDIX hydrolase [Bacteroidia bacterium]